MLALGVVQRVQPSDFVGVEEAADHLAHLSSRSLLFQIHAQPHVFAQRHQQVAAAVAPAGAVMGQFADQPGPPALVAGQRQRLRRGAEFGRQQFARLRLATRAGLVRQLPYPDLPEAPGLQRLHQRHAPVHKRFTPDRLDCTGRTAPGAHTKGDIGMGIIIWLIVGGVVGWLASLIMRRDAQQGIILNIVVGIIGAMIAGFLFSGGSINGAITLRSFLLSLVGAVILLAIVNLFTRKSIR